MFLFSILLCGMAASAFAAATALFESFALCFLPLFHTYARSRASSSNMVQSQNSRTVVISALLFFFFVITSAWPGWTVIFNAIRFFRMCVYVPLIVRILFGKQLVMYLLNLNLHDTAHPLKNAASYLMFCKQQIASNYLNCKSICGQFYQCVYVCMWEKWT